MLIKSIILLFTNDYCHLFIVVVVCCYLFMIVSFLLFVYHCLFVLIPTVQLITAP